MVFRSLDNGKLFSTTLRYCLQHVLHQQRAHHIEGCEVVIQLKRLNWLKRFLIPIVLLVFLPLLVKVEKNPWPLYHHRDMEREQVGKILTIPLLIAYDR
jgi:hypothetical protein